MTREYDGSPKGRIFYIAETESSLRRSKKSMHVLLYSYVCNSLPTISIRVHDKYDVLFLIKPL